MMSIDRFGWPWAFGLLIVVALFAAWCLVRGRRRSAGVPIPTPKGAHLTSWRSRTRWVPMVLRVMALGLLAIAIARPQEVKGQSETSTEGVAIQILLDRSSSMAEGMQYEGARVSRLDGVKQAAATFIFGNGKAMKGRAGDLIGLISFARFADTVCPLAREHDAMHELLDGVDLVAPRSAEDGTAIGEAIALAAARLRSADEQNKKDKGEQSLVIKSKAIVLLTDGENTAGEVDPVSAARLAAEWGIKIYAVGIGERGGRGFFSQGGVDERLLQRLAEETGGEAYLAQSASDLERVYERIDSLEKSTIRSNEYTNVNELAGPLAVGVMVMTCVELLLQSFVYRRAA